MRNLKGKTMIITGAAGGIGTEIAKLFDAHGVQLVLSDINSEGLARTSRKLTREPLCFNCDITNPEQVHNLVMAAVERFGTVDILMNNAGIIEPSLFEHSTAKDIQRQVDINLMGTITCTREVIPVMKKAGGGHIATISSMAGIVPETHGSIYTATKFALRGFNLALAIELRHYCIGVSTIFPDSVITPMLSYEAEHPGGSPITFLNTPQEPATVAKAVLNAISNNRVEVYVPVSTGIFSKLIMCWPWAVTKLWPLFEYLGARKKAAAARQIRQNLEQ